MNIHEYQAKELLRRYGVAVLDGHVARSPEEAETAAKRLPGPVYVVKRRSMPAAAARAASRTTRTARVASAW
jgi:succinyl-CoA synthetase beta subunit